MAREEDMVKLVESWRSSGKSRIVFAREAGIPISTLHRWIRRVAQQQSPPLVAPSDGLIETPPGFIEIAREESVAHEQAGRMQPTQEPRERSPRMRLELGDGVILTLY